MCMKEKDKNTNDSVSGKPAWQKSKTWQHGDQRTGNEEIERVLKNYSLSTDSLTPNGAPSKQPDSDISIRSAPNSIRKLQTAGLLPFFPPQNRVEHETLKTKLLKWVVLGCVKRHFYTQKSPSTLRPIHLPANRTAHLWILLQVGCMCVFSRYMYCQGRGDRSCRIYK